MSNKPEPVLKRCRCSPSCYKWLHHRTRRKHYSTVDPDQLLSLDLGSNSDVGMQDESGEEEEEESLDGSEPSEADEVSSVASEVRSVQSEEGDELAYDEEEELVDEHLEDIIQQLRDWHGPGKEERLHQIRAHLSQLMDSYF
ncbi:hypothetical protein EV363DRAFT_1177932 [Boletus edulis]|nr:hypothetical protein EV363DRAFT_1177932 [Boletus edulis]